MSHSTYPKLYSYRRIVQAKLFIDQHFNQPINLNNISGEACFSAFHFTRLFKKVYGKTPHQYLIAVRMDKAMSLLKDGMPVSATCYAVGFESPGSFSSLFKRTTGISPSDYLLQQQILKIQVRQTPLKFVPGCFAAQTGWLKNSNFEEVTC